ncbi:MAG: dihydropteroate synthase [Bacteroidia bacterium]|nr:dihydropteroate synthase [Bacteroidia bacterium]
MLFAQNNKAFYKKKPTIALNGELIDLGSPVVMGVLNCTPDSFYDGGAYSSDNAILTRAGQIIEQGGRFVDIGGMSTRPGAIEVSVEEELNRLIPAVTKIRKEFPNAALSIDTYRAEVVSVLHAEVGDFLVNDISGGQFDDQMFLTVAALNVPYLLMHSKGKSVDMQDKPQYKDVVKEIILYLSHQIQKLKQFGISDILIDPGFGFGKTTEHNFELLNRLDSFAIFELPIVVGLSRKSMICKSLNIDPSESLNGTTVLNTIALSNGCDILRVHDVKEAIEAIRLIEKTKIQL